MALVAAGPCCARAVARPGTGNRVTAAHRSVARAALPAGGGGRGGDGGDGRRGGGGHGRGRRGGSGGEGGAPGRRALSLSLLCATGALLHPPRAIAEETSAGVRGANESVPQLSAAVASAVRACVRLSLRVVKGTRAGVYAPPGHTLTPHAPSTACW